jgi:hypothetical protein
MYSSVKIHSIWRKMLDSILFVRRNMFALIKFYVTRNCISFSHLWAGAITQDGGPWCLTVNCQTINILACTTIPKLITKRFQPVEVKRWSGMISAHAVEVETLVVNSAQKKISTEIVRWATALLWSNVHLFDQDLAPLHKCRVTDILDPNTENLINSMFGRNKFVIGRSHSYYKPQHRFNVLLTYVYEVC